MAVKLDRTQFPDTLGQQAQARIAKAVDDLSKRDELFASPVAVIVSTQAIKAGTSIAVWGGPAGGVLVLPPAAAQGKNTGAVIYVLNTTASALTIACAAQETVDGGNTISLPGGQPIELTSDGGSKWLSIGKPVPPPAPDIQEFAASGTWTKPPTVNGLVPKWVRVELVPWGASGGSGRRGAIGSDGGSGAGASGVAQWEGPASILGATEAVTFGAQPLGGAAQTVNNTNGNNGTDAPDATFGVWLAARGGKKGLGGIAGGPTAGGAGGYGNMGTGGTGATSAGAAATVGTGRAAGGAGAGGNIGVAGMAGANAGPDRATTLTGGIAGPAGAAGGQGGASSVGEIGGGGGAGGGGGESGGVAGAGANGVRYGAPGGGGGASNNGVNSGKGGDGGPCFARVTTFYL